MGDKDKINAACNFSGIRKTFILCIFLKEFLNCFQVDNGSYCPHHHADVHGAGGVMQEADVQEGGSCTGLRREV